jgi:hypothetical protein
MSSRGEVSDEGLRDLYTNILRMSARDDGSGQPLHKNTPNLLEISAPTPDGLQNRRALSRHGKAYPSPDPETAAAQPIAE